jgi:hypothetical protein
MMFSQKAPCVQAVYKVVLVSWFELSLPLMELLYLELSSEELP